jgi:hypothetical protein
LVINGIMGEGRGIMRTVEELRAELETIISNLSASGFNSIDSEILDKLDKFAQEAGSIGLVEGKRLMENLSGVMKAIQEGKSQAESGNVRLTALSFYVKNLSGSGSIEEL